MKIQVISRKKLNVQVLMTLNFQNNAPHSQNLPSHEKRFSDSFPCRLPPSRQYALWYPQKTSANINHIRAYQKKKKKVRLKTLRHDSMISSNIKMLRHN